jgi:hypothetical protein
MILIPGKVGAWACKVHSRFLPSGSPELILAERLWSSSNEAIAKRLFEEISEVEETLMERCHQLLGQAKTIRVLTTYHWWPHGMMPEELSTRTPYDGPLTPYPSLTAHLATSRPVPSSSALARRKTDGGTPPVSVSKEGLCCSTASRTSRTESITSWGCSWCM